MHSFLQVIPEMNSMEMVCMDNRTIEMVMVLLILDYLLSYRGRLRQVTLHHHSQAPVHSVIVAEREEARAVL